MTENTSARIERALQEQLAAGCAASVFPGASASVAFWDRGGWHYVDAVAGLLAKGALPVTVDTFYDLASLTKP
ncbi:MAG: hypothetical protein KJN97_06330, partial [Deltaproteobacteria bacterium]|nr:hypothetical protein [Deltaproteobacteria bacterium]